MRKAFTVVEIIVLIVIIGILASVTLVSFSSVSQRAVVANIQSDLTNSAKKLELYQAENSTYPYLIDCSASPASTSICLKYSSNASYIYRGKANDFCLSLSYSNETYYINESGNITQGLCPIINYVLSPGFENNTYGSGGGIGINFGTSTIQSTGGQTGTYFYRLFFASYQLGRGQFTPNLEPGIYTASFWIRSNQAVGYSTYFEGTAAYSVVSQNPGFATLSPNVWTKFTRTIKVTTNGTIKVGGYVPNYAAWTTSDYIDMDSFILTEGFTSYSFADGSYSGWSWGGTSNLSTSSGLPL